MARRKTAWGRLSAVIRNTFAAQGRQQYGLSRRQVAARVARGTWDPQNPGSVPRGRNKQPLPRIDTPARRRYVSPMAGPASGDFDDAFDRLRIEFGSRPLFNQDALERRFHRGGQQAWIAILYAEDHDIWTWVASGVRHADGTYSPAPGDPDWLWTDTGTEYINILWYH